MSSSESALKALARLIETGVADSARLLTEVSQTAWTARALSISSAPLADLTMQLPEDTARNAGALFTMPAGGFLVIFPHASRQPLSNAFFADRSADRSTRLESESLAEIANLMVHSVANVIADACDEVLFVSAPTFLEGSVETILKTTQQRIRNKGSAVIAHVHLFSPALSSQCNVILILNDTWKERLFKALDS